MSKIKIPKRCLTTSREIITFDAYDLINEVRSRPILWDKKCEKRNRINIDLAWNDICRIFVPYFDQLNDDEQLFVANFFRSSWKNITSLMIKNYSQKKRGNRKICLYHHTRDLDFYLESRGLNIEDVASERELQELDDLDLKRRAASEHKKNIQKVLKVNNVSSNNTQSKIDQSDTDILEINKSLLPILDDVTYDSFKLSEYDDHNNSEGQDEHEYDFRRRQQTNFSFRSAKCVGQSSDADQAFFDSLKPFLRKTNESQKLEFKIQVLELIKKYRTS